MPSSRKLVLLLKTLLLKSHLEQKHNSRLPKVVMDSYYRFSHPDYVSGPVDVRINKSINKK